MAALSLEEGMLTDCLLTICPLRTRVNISAIGSLMLIYVYLLPAGLGHARHFATHGHFAQFVAGDAELAVYTPGTPGDSAARTQTRRAGIARKALQLETSLVAFFVRLGLIIDDGTEFGTLGCVLLYQLCAFDFAIDE